MKNDSWIERVLYLWPVKVLSLAGAILLFFFTNYLVLENRFISVPIRYILPAGYIQGDEYPSTARISLRGIPDKIFPIAEDDLLVSADLRMHATEGVFSTELKIRRLGAVADIDPLEIKAQPESVTVTLERIAYKDVPIELKFSGRPKLGYDLLSQSISLSSVRVAGPRSRLADVQSVSTEDIDLSIHDADFVQQVHVRSPDPLVQIMGDDLVELRATIKESVGTAIFNEVAIDVVGLESGLIIPQKMPLGMMRVQATQGLLNKIDASQVRMIIDASTLKAPGVYTVKVIPEAPSGGLILQFEPATLEIRIEAANVERNTP